MNGVPVTNGAKVADLTTWSVVLSQEQIHALAEGVRPTVLASKNKSLITKYHPLDNLTAAAEVGTEEEENHRMGFVSATAVDGAAWDRWYASLPSYLRRKLSLHDFKRLGDCFESACAPAADVGEQEPTAEHIARHLCAVFDSPAEVGECVCPTCGAPEPDWNAAAAFDAQVATIERCAQVAHKYTRSGTDSATACAYIIECEIRALEDKP